MSFSIILPAFNDEKYLGRTLACINRATAEQLSRDTLGYEVKQTLLLHANEINADHFDKLAAMMKRRGYRFIPLAEALTDPAYQTPVSFTPRGDSWLHRWRVTKGLPTRTEPRDPEWLSRLLESYARR